MSFFCEIIFIYACIDICLWLFSGSFKILFLFLLFRMSSSLLSWQSSTLTFDHFYYSFLNNICLFFEMVFVHKNKNTKAKVLWKIKVMKEILKLKLEIHTTTSMQANHCWMYFSLSCHMDIVQIKIHDIFSTWYYVACSCAYSFFFYDVPCFDYINIKISMSTEHEWQFHMFYFCLCFEQFVDVIFSAMSNATAMALNNNVSNAQRNVRTVFSTETFVQWTKSAFLFLFPYFVKQNVFLWTQKTVREYFTVPWWHWSSRNSLSIIVVSFVQRNFVYHYTLIWNTRLGIQMEDRRCHQCCQFAFCIDRVYDHWHPQESDLQVVNDTCRSSCCCAVE